MLWGLILKALVSGEQLVTRGLSKRADELYWEIQEKPGHYERDPLLLYF